MSDTAPPLRRLNVTKLSDQIVVQLETMIVEGSFKPGDRLPPERQQAEQLGVSRPSLREAIQKLAARGLLQSRQGGGTFVTDQLDSGFADPWQEMIGKHPELHRDVLEFRRMLEGTVAELAATRATDADLERIGRIFGQIEASYSNVEVSSKFDVQLHQAIADAAHNALFTHLTSSLLSMLQAHVHDNVANLFAVGPVAEQLLGQHRAIWEGIRARDPKAARKAAESHIDFVDETLSSLREEEVRRQRALRRTGG
ncbi:FCD domain-containing protein [Derxia gummosa]|uniref:Pyruvate dehydrogenase complex repressor n=1 Tax=Derxia gummosa DSM 723 TaxID=1121388 RepID=A0A8B6X375_9BURK|nr:FCD domain-containing protein [Derxia gummosa]